MLELRATALAILANADAKEKISQLFSLFESYQHQQITDLRNWFHWRCRIGDFDAFSHAGSE